MKATRIVLSWVGALAVVVVALPGFTYTTWASDQEVLSVVQSATVQFHRTDVARLEGYEPFLPCMQEVGVGGMGYHFVNFSIVDLNIEPQSPEAMVYAPGPNGQLQLGAVEYIVPADAWDKAGNTRPPSLFGQTFSRNEMLGIYALHAWVWKHNSSGMYAPWNPSVSCNRNYPGRVQFQ